jgi:hypothetical protein
MKDNNIKASNETFQIIDEHMYMCVCVCVCVCVYVCMCILIIQTK